MIMNSLLILCKSCRYTLPGNELDSGDKHVRQRSGLNFTDTAALKIKSERVGKEVKPYRRL